MAVEIETPENYMGDVIGDINRRRGRVEGMKPGAGNTQIISCQVPLSEMFGYATDVRGMTQGRASFTMTPSHYEEVPRNVAEELLAKANGKQPVRA
jgi:elongation factor G